MRHLGIIFSTVLCLLATSYAGAQTSAPNWQNWGFLMGEWTGSGSGDPGQGTGGFTFKTGLQERVLERTNYAEYPATKERPAYRHDDLMVIYQEAAKGPVRAMYFDNEGHVIHYTVEINPSSRTATFLSEAETGRPRYRLSYVSKTPDLMSIKFEVAPPDKPGQFQTYIEATAKRAVK